MRLVSVAVLLALALSPVGCGQNSPPQSPAPQADGPSGGEPVAVARATADQTPPEKSSPAEKGVDPDVLLGELADFYLKKQSAQVEFSQQLETEFNGMKNSMEMQAAMVVARPNRLAIRYTEAQSGADVVCDGEQLSISIAPLKQYTQSPAPQSLDELLAHPAVAAGIGGAGPRLNVFASDPGKKLMEGVTRKTYAGRETIDDVEAHHLTFEQPQFDWDLWIAADGQPRMLRAKFDLSKALASGGIPPEQLKNAKMILTQQYRNWRFDEQTPVGVFAFEPPEGSKKVENFLARRAGGEADEPSPLIGKPAPDVELALLDGEPFKLASLKDKEVVILDFWATWCGPCVREMPVVAKVAEAYRDQNVRLYCLNQQEEAEVVRAFLDERKLDVTVVLDAKGEAGEAYGVRGIPMLVLIDKAGVVRSVHIGFSPGIRETLEEELDAILAGKELPDESKPADESKSAGESDEDDEPPKKE